MDQDVIVALSTPEGPAPRGILRLSGAGARELAARIFKPHPSGHDPRSLERGVCRGFLVLGRSGVTCEASLWLHPRGASFTGEDLVEMHLPGSPPLLQAVQGLLVRLGARLAGPGEFTRRAFENGRIDLTRAEAVAAVIRAADDEEREAALALLEGGLEKRVAVLRDRIVGCLVHLEVSLDFSDQDLDVDLPPDLDVTLREVEAEVAELAGRSRERAGRPRARVVLEGPANAGKSSLFNSLLGAEEALVSRLPGTTRDVVLAEFEVSGMPIQLVDTAGDDVLRVEADRLAHRQRRRFLREADLVLEVRDGRRTNGRPPRRRPGRLRVHTHADLLEASGGMEGEVLIVSNVTGTGLDRLRDAMVRSLRRAREGRSGLLINARHGEAFSRVREHLERGRRALREGLGPELVAADLRAALLTLGGVTGEVTDQLVLDRIFSSFCIGK